MMKKLVLLFISLTFIFISCSGSPRIKFSELKHNFGKVKVDSTVKHVFKFKNTGKGLLKIEKVKAG